MRYKLLIFDWEGTLMAPNRVFFPGVREMLLMLKKDYLLAVATNRYRRSLDRLIKDFQLENVFAASRCADESGAKPNPQMLIDILEELGVTAGEALMIGDSESDMIMARKLGMPRIAVIDNESARSIYLRYEPLYCLLNISDLLKFLRD